MSYRVIHRHRQGTVTEAHYDTEADAVEAVKTSTATLASAFDPQGVPIYSRNRNGDEWGRGRHVTIPAGFPPGRSSR